MSSWKDVALVLTFSAVVLWMAASYVDTNVKNMDTRDYAPWNVFVLLSK